MWYLPKILSYRHERKKKKKICSLGRRKKLSSNRCNSYTFARYNRLSHALEVNIFLPHESEKFQHTLVATASEVHVDMSVVAVFIVEGQQVDSNMERLTKTA